MDIPRYDVIIIGGGPAGLTAAIYTSRAFLKTLIITGKSPGGQLVTTSEVENFPGFPDGISGAELMQKFRDQAERFNADCTDDHAEKVEEIRPKLFRVKTINGEMYDSKALIIATGASAKWLGLESEKRLRGRGVSACATCDGPFFKNKIVAVVGGGDAAMEEATFMTKFSPKVYVLVRKGKEDLRASKIMQEEAFNNSKIEFIFNSEVVEVLGENSVEGLRIKNSMTNEERALDDVRGMFVAIGHKPDTDFLKGFIDIGKKGYLKVENYTRTSREGVFAAGDVADFRYRQAVTAAGFGCMAAIDAEKYLSSSIHNEQKY